MVEKQYINSLILRIAKDDEKALEELYQIMNPVMKQIAQRILNKPEHVDDVLAESFLKIYQKGKSFKREYNGIDWIYGIVRNQAIDYNRWMNRDIKIEPEECRSLSYAETGRVTQKEELRYALKRLEREEYEIVTLKIWERWTLRQIAKKYDYTVAKVYRIYDEALRKLRQMLE